MISVNIYEADYQVIENISLRQNGIYSDKKILVTFCAFWNVRKMFKILLHKHYNATV